MKLKFSTKKLMAIGALVIMKLLIKMMLYSSLLAATGNAFSGLSTVFIGPLFIVLVLLITNQVGAGTIFATLDSLTALLLPQVWPPVAVIFFGPILGIFIDLIFSLYKKRPKTFSIIGGFIYELGVILISVALFFSVGVFGTRNVPAFLIKPLGLVLFTMIISLLGSLVGYLAFLSYQRIKSTAVVKRIQK